MIRIIQDRGNFAFTLSDKDSFDVGELKAKMKRIWNFQEPVAYECQTNSIAEEINKCIERSRKLSTGMVFVANSNEIAMKIRESTRCECIVLQ